MNESVDAGDDLKALLFVVEKGAEFVTFNGAPVRDFLVFRLSRSCVWRQTLAHLSLPSFATVSSTTQRLTSPSSSSTKRPSSTPWYGYPHLWCSWAEVSSVVQAVGDDPKLSFYRPYQMAFDPAMVRRVLPISLNPYLTRESFPDCGLHHSDLLRDGGRDLVRLPPLGAVRGLYLLTFISF